VIRDNARDRAYTYTHFGNASRSNTKESVVNPSHTQDQEYDQFRYVSPKLAALPPNVQSVIQQLVWNLEDAERYIREAEGPEELRSDVEDALVATLAEFGVYDDERGLVMDISYADEYGTHEIGDYFISRDHERLHAEGYDRVIAPLVLARALAA
jgi:hypothetical protein